MASIFSIIRGFFGGGATSQGTGTQDGRPSRRNSDDLPPPSIDAALQTSSVWACIELLADTIASLPLFVYTKQAGPDGHKVLARESMLWKILHVSPNRRNTPMEFFQVLAINFFLRGNAYARLVRNGRGEVIEMWPLSSDQMVVEALASGELVYKYTIDGTTIVYSEKSIFHWRDKGNGIVGLSRLDYMASTVNLSTKAQAHAAKSFRKAGKRPGVFMIDKLLTKEQRELIRKNYAGLIEGDDDELIVLEAEAKFQPLSLSPQDMQLMEVLRMTVEETARWFGISSVLINDTTKATTWGSGIQQIIEAFYKFRLRAILTSLEQAIFARILTPRERETMDVEFEIDGLLRGSLKDRMELGAKGVQNGLYTRNEWRQRENLPPNADGNKLTAQSNLTTLDKLGVEVPKPSLQDKPQGNEDDQTEDSVAQ